ncbi:MAG: alpha/beta hydrolase fold domain-containing protein [Opitutaceae bacterium]|jgi:acetyl esterase/lipase/quercetin dioxygenase-like cupin family protein|nr:alpha/beta hydrolase fold domain-containing protein [Opitutaceae bacterium]
MNNSKSRRHARLHLPAIAMTLLSTSLAASQPAVIPLWPEGVPGLRSDAAPDKGTPAHASAIHHPSMAFYPAKTRGAAPAVVVCPGGGYHSLSMQNEGGDVAAWLNSIGVSAFVLKYRLREYGQPAPLQDVLRALRIVRADAAKFGVLPDRVGVLGFSAGGHLASCAATLFDTGAGKTGAPLDATSARPDFAVLVYPVISMRDDIGHRGSRKNLLGEKPSAELVDFYSTDERVTKDTPPVFLIAGSDDKTVRVQNSVRFYLALRQEGVPAELHIYQTGPHGFGMKTTAGNASAWPARCEDWMRANGWLAEPAPLVESGVYAWDELVVRDTRTGQSRAVFNGSTPALQMLESHVTTLAPGAVMHAPPGHSHPDDELLVVKEGSLEVVIDGKTQTARAGALIYFASGSEHAMRNPSADAAATYYVVRVLPRHLRPAVKAAQKKRKATRKA